jgi:hypothetical protein
MNYTKKYEKLIGKTFICPDQLEYIEYKFQESNKEFHTLITWKDKGGKGCYVDSYDFASVFDYLKNGVWILSGVKHLMIEKKVK